LLAASARHEAAEDDVQRGSDVALRGNSAQPIMDYHGGVRM
jgi:hypothetical protein